MKWADLPLDRPVGTIMLLVSLTVLGGVSLFQIPMGFMPVVQEPEIDIDIPFPGSHPLEGLREIALPIEDELATIPEVKAIFVNAGGGSVNVETQFEHAANLDLKKMEVRDAVERARSRLPQGIGHIRVEGDTDGPGAEVLGGRISAVRDLSESWELLDRRIRRPLERVRGVARVDLYGVEPQQVRIDLDLDAIKRHELDVGALVARIDAANLDLDLGSIRGDLLRYDVRAVGRFRDVESLSALVIDSSGLQLQDVADVRLREPVLDYGRHLNRNFAIGFDVFKEPTANTIETVDRLVARIEEIRRDPELKGIDLLAWNNSGEEIRIALTGLRNAGLFGGLLAISVLYLFLRRASTTAIVAVAIPFSLLVTCGAMFVFGFEFNVLTMLGLMLGVGMLVDNAVVVIENIYRLQGRGMAPREAARLGTRQVSLAVVASTATTLIVWSWLLIAERDAMTIYIGQVAFTVCLAVVCSLIISLTFIPLAAARFVPRGELREGFLMRYVVPRYRTVLRWTLRHRAATLVSLLALAGSAAIPFSALEKSDQPRSQTRDVSIFYRIHDASTKDVVEQHVDVVEEWISSHADELGYESLYSWYSETSGAVTRIYLPREDATEKAIEALRDRLQGGLPTIAGVDFEIGNQRGRHRGPRKQSMIRVALHGEDPEYLEKVAAEVEERMRDLPHLVEIYGPSLVGRQEVRLRIDGERARAFGITPLEIANTVGFAFRGQQLRRFKGGHGEIDVLLGLPETARPGMAGLADLSVPSATGEPVALSAVADIETYRTPPSLFREDRKTTAWVAVELDEKEVKTEEAKLLIAERLETLRLPEGYSWNWGRQMRQEDEGLGVMLRGLMLSLLLVVLLMAALFESWTQPLAIIVTLPLAFFGAFWALWLGGFLFEPVAFIGIIILIGLVVNNGIVLVDHVNRLRGDGMSRSEALLEGCGDRLRPVLMTAITTVVGLTPLAMSQFTVAGVYIDSLAVGMMGGLITSTVFTLIALPVWYTTIEDLGSLLAHTLPEAPGPSRFALPREDVLVSRERGA